MVENDLRDSPASSSPQSATQAAGEGGEGGGTGSDSDSEDLLAAACRTPPPSAPRKPQADAAPKPSSAECPACKGRHRPHTCGSHGKAAVEARAAVRAAARAAGPTDAGASATGLKRSCPAVVGQRGPILDSWQQKALTTKLEKVRARLAQVYQSSIYVHPRFRAVCNLEDDDKVRERFIMSNAMIKSVCAGMSQSTKELAGVPLNKVALMDCMGWGESKVYHCCSRSVGGEHVGELGDAVLTTVKDFVASH